MRCQTKGFKVRDLIPSGTRENFGKVPQNFHDDGKSDLVQDQNIDGKLGNRSKVTVK
jgi:hypothetical protein